MIHRILPILLCLAIAAAVPARADPLTPDQQKQVESIVHDYLVAHPEVLTLYQQIVDRVNASLASFETLKRVHIVAEEWTLDSGEMTPSMKLKRSVVVQRYAEQIDSFYTEEVSSRR